MNVVIVATKRERNRTMGRAEIAKFAQVTVIQDTLKIGKKYSTVPRAQERVSERSELCRASERVSGASERASR